MRQRTGVVAAAADGHPWASLSVAAIAAVAAPQPPGRQSTAATPDEGLRPGLAALKGYQAAEWCGGGNKLLPRRCRSFKRAQPSST